MSHRIERVDGERTQIHFERKDGRRLFTAVHPFYGSANAKDLQTQIEADGLAVPTSRQVTIFANEMYCGKEPEEQEFTNRMITSSLVAFTGAYFDIETRMVYFIDYPKFDECGVIDTEKLEERVGEHYHHLSFFDCVEGGVSWMEIRTNPYIRAWAGEECVDQLVDLASKHLSKGGASRFVPNASTLRKPFARLTSLNSERWGHDSSRLRVSTYYGGDYSDFYAFGILKNVSD